MQQHNQDPKTVQGFGEEWSRFDQTALSELEKKKIFESYFAIFPWNTLPATPIGADFGCGSGRWATQVAPKVGKLIALDASFDALQVAQKNLSGFKNIEFLHQTIDSCSIPNESLDFGYSLGVLHHIPSIETALQQISRKLKPGAPFLVYLYYAFDNQPFYFRAIWKLSDWARKIISRLPFTLKKYVCEGIALFCYWPLARTAKILEQLGFSIKSWPLSFYRNKSFYTMRTDSLDRLGTRLENRYSRVGIQNLLKSAGFENIRFSDAEPYWCAVANKSK